MLGKEKMQSKMQSKYGTTKDVNYTQMRNGILAGNFPAKNSNFPPKSGTLRFTKDVEKGQLQELGAQWANYNATKSHLPRPYPSVGLVNGGSTGAVKMGGACALTTLKGWVGCILMTVMGYGVSLGLSLVGIADGMCGALGGSLLPLVTGVWGLCLRLVRSMPILLTVMVFLWIIPC